MAFTCNIDSRGRKSRLISGIVMMVLGMAVIAFLAVPFHTVVLWIIAIVLLLSGAFAIFEARMGWCAMRAMGFKTKV